MGPLRRNPRDRLYAVAVRESEELRLIAWVKVSAKGEIFVFNPGRDEEHQPHVSLHVGRNGGRTGVLHAKSYPDKRRPRPVVRVPRPSPSALPAQGVQVDVFQGPTVAFVQRMGAAYSASDFSDVFEIPISTLDHGKHQLTTDVVPIGGAPLAPPGARICLTKRFAEGDHEIVVVLWDTPEYSQI